MKGNLSQTAILAALAAIIVGATPSVTDAYESWRERPETRGPLVIWYGFAVGLAIMAWRRL